MSGISNSGRSSSAPSPSSSLLGRPSLGGSLLLDLGRWLGVDEIIESERALGVRVVRVLLRGLLEELIPSVFLPG